MLFCSEAYLLFFSCFFFVYWAIPWQRARVYLLLIASFGFYASWNHWLAILITLSATIDYALARAIEASPSARVRKLLLAVNIVANLGLLCYFKYVNFFLESLQTTLRSLGADASIPLLSVILPVGISFYTFEAISYVVDVYRRKAPAERNLAHFLLFITFFPHLVAGPIVRAKDFLPQAMRPKHWDWARINLGAQYFLMGLFKKLAIADRMAAFVDPVFKNPSAALGAGRLLESCGLKGFRIGGALISPKHANFIENAGDATTADCIALMAEAHRRAREQHGVELEHEVVLLGDLSLP